MYKFSGRRRLKGRSERTEIARPEKETTKNGIRRERVFAQTCDMICEMLANFVGLVLGCIEADFCE